MQRGVESPSSIFVSPASGLLRLWIGHTYGEPNYLLLLFFPLVASSSRIYQGLIRATANAATGCNASVAQATPPATQDSRIYGKRVLGDEKRVTGRVACATDAGKENA
jgi:hypothetical protein